MKKALSLLLSALILLSALPALAQGYTLDEKLSKQVKDGSGLRMNISFEKTGGSFSLLDATGNAALSVLTQGTSLSLRYLKGVGTLKGKEDLELALTKSNQPLADLKLVKDLQLEALSSSLLGGVSYVDVRDGGLLMALLTGQNVTWPPIEGLLLKANTAESTWQAAAGRKLDSYTAKLSVWLQGFTKTSTEQGPDNKVQTKAVITVPAEQLKSQIKQLLMDLYADAELLALLSQEMDGRQAAAYLQPGMMNGFFTALDQLKLTGNVESTRIFDDKAKLVESHLVLPLGGARGVNKLTQEYSLAADGTEINTWTLDMLPKDAKNPTGAVHSLSYQKEGLADAPKAQVYTGTYALTPEAGEGGFTVEEGQQAPGSKQYSFNLFINPGEESTDPATRRSSREDEITLLITPQGENAPAAQSLSLKIRLESGDRTNSATSFKGTLTWQDQGSEGLVTATIDGSSAPPWQIADVDPQGKTRVDTMSKAQLDGLSQQIKQTLQGAFAQILLKLTAPVATTAP